MFEESAPSQEEQRTDDQRAEDLREELACGMVDEMAGGIGERMRQERRARWERMRKEDEAEEGEGRIDSGELPPFSSIVEGAEDLQADERDISREVSMSPPPPSPTDEQDTLRLRIPSGPELQLRQLHSRFLALIPMHLVGAAFFMLQYVASFHHQDSGKTLLAVYVQFVDVADYHLPALADAKATHLDLSHFNLLRKRILRLYLFLATYVCSMTGHDRGMEFAQEYDTLVHIRQTRATLVTRRLNLAEYVADHFIYANADGPGNPVLTHKERFWFLAMADTVFMEHARRLGYNEATRGAYEDALANVIIRFANECPPHFPPVQEVLSEIVP